VIDELKKENFSLKLKVHFLEERLAQLAPDHIETALKQNINLKIEVQSRGVELKKYKKLLLQMEQELSRAKDQSDGPRERELQAEVESLTRELRELRRRKMGSGRDDVALSEAKGRNDELELRLAQLEEELEGAKALIKENLDEIDRLREEGGQNQYPDGSMSSGSGENRRAKLEEALRNLEGDNALLQDKLEELANELNNREDEKEELADKVEALTLHIEELQQRQEAAALERSQSRANLAEEEQEREDIINTINAMRDKLAATNIELQQKEEEISAKTDEIEEIIAEHESIVRDIESSWRGEVAEAKQQVDDMRDSMAEQEKEAARLREQVADLEANTAELHSKFEAALAHLEAQAEEREDEIIDANRQITELSEKLWKLEETLEQERDDARIRLDEAEMERERTDMVLTALKEVRNCLLLLIVLTFLFAT